jgi:hypothetical protein
MATAQDAPEPPEPAPQAYLERLRDLFAADAIKLLLSTLIIVSLMPFDWVQRVSLLFFVIFAAELTGRALLLRHQWRQSRTPRPVAVRGDYDHPPSRLELLLLVIDLVATLSFLPLDPLVDVRLLRLVRLSRMLLLLSYWSPIGREIWLILAKRERRYQLLFVASIVVILTFTSALLLFYLGVESIDFNEDGSTKNESFWTMVWWSFRQLQDPGNLVKGPHPTLAFGLSLLLTLGGIFVVAFLIGIGASVVGELVSVGRERRLGLRNHSLICNLGRHSGGLVAELVNYYEKTGRAPRLATLGQAPSRYDYMYDDVLRPVRYRCGSPSSKHDLLKVDADRARRIILLSEGEDNLADSEVISQMLSVREVNPSCPIYAELNRVDNVAAARVAGGTATIPILAHHLVSLLLADIISFPGVEQVYRQLLSSHGNEIYTCIYGTGALEEVAQPTISRPLPFAKLLEHGYRKHGVLLLGYLLDDGHGGVRHVLNPRAVPETTVRGYVGLAPGFDRLRDCVCGLPAQAAGEPSSHEKRHAAPDDHSDTDQNTKRDQDDEDAAATPSLPELALRPIEQPHGAILICGFHDGLPELCRQLAIFASGVELFVMVPKAEHEQLLTRSLRDNRKIRSGGRQSESLLQSTLADDEKTLLLKSKSGTSRVRIIAGDWTEGDTLLRERDKYSLARVETIVLTYTLDDDDPDARTALTLLKLHDLFDSATEHINEHLRVICEVRSDEKAHLLQTRFASDRANVEGSPQTVIIPTEQLRHAVLAQSVFVPELAQIYEELLGFSDYELCKLQARSRGETSPRQSDIDFGRLLIDVYQQHRMLPLAVEIWDDDAQAKASIVVNPAHHQRFDPALVRALYAIRARATK